MFSVVIPALNEEKYIGTCLKSLRNQNYSGKYEIIVMDNGSTDKTVEIAEKYSDRLFIEPDCSLPNLRNKGIDLAKGDKIAMIDSDCQAKKNWLKEAEKSLKKSIMVTGSVEPIEDSFFYKFWFWLFSDVFLHYSVNYFGLSNSMGGNCAFFRDKAIEIDGFKDVFPSDGKFGFEMGRTGRLSHNTNMRIKTSARRYIEMSFSKLLFELISSHIKMRMGKEKDYSECYYWNGN